MPQPRKRFGQHFLHDQGVIERIIRVVNPQPDQHLAEIGPGRGALTFPLLKRCKRLLAIELDRDLIPLLQQQSKDLGDLKLINADILEFELSTLPGDHRYRLVGNLPYNISTPLMFHLLESTKNVHDMHFMVQKEVALRLVAATGEANYGRLSVMMQNRCQCAYLFEVEADSFTPPPKVTSAVIRMTPRAQPLVEAEDFAQFSKIVRTAFNQRRKTIANSLKTILDRSTLEACQIEPTLRAENLSLEDYARLSRACGQ